MNAFFLHKMYCFVSCGIKSLVGVFVITLMTLTMASCRCQKEIEYVTRVEQVHDTIREHTSDTVKITEVRYDSIDRYVEKITYVDSNGVVHEKEIEHLTKIITIQKEESQKTISDLRSKISILEEKLKESETVREVKKPLNWYEKTWIILGWCFIAVFLGFLVYVYLRVRKII